MKQAITFYQKIKQHSHRLLCLMLLTQAFVLNSFAQTQLELSNGSYPAAPNGLTLSNQTASLLQNTSGSTFTTFNPTITVTASISNQQYNAIATSRVSTGKGISFGGRVNSYGTTATQMPVYNSLNTVDNPVNAQYTSNSNGPSSTGIDVADNYGFYFYNSVDELFTTNAATNGRYYFGDITLTFSQPVSNPVIHINGLGCNVLFGITDKQGITSELELQTSGITLSKLSGSSEFDVTANKILNNAAVPTFNCGSGAACGSVKCAGTNITTLTFKVYVRGDGNGSAWSHNSINAGDEFMLSASINKPDTISGNVFNDMNGLTDNTVNGTGTNLSGALYMNLVDGNNNVVASVAVASNGSYTFPNIGDGNYTLVLSTTQGTQGNTAPAASLPTGWVNTGENIGTSAGNDGNVNGILPVTMNGANVVNANFGVVYCSNILPTTITANGATTACLGAGLTLTSTSAISYQWYRDTTPIASATSQSYIPTVSGTYTMHIITGGGACNISSNAISVTINYAPTIGITPSDTANICVSANDKICPATWGSSNYQWYKNGVAMAAPQGTSSCLYPTSAGNYSLAVQTGAGCWSLPSASVYVKIDTICNGSVTGGNGGGVESKSLGDVISKRLYGNAINSIPIVNGYSNSQQFVKNSGTVVNGNGGLALKDLIPAKTSNTINAFVTTPADLVDFTNAIEVLSVDYTDNYNTKAVAFGTKTLGEIYSHTKPICDRLKEAQLLDIRKINVDGYNVMASTLKQRGGEVEYCINLSIGAKAGRNYYSLQSNWLTDNYSKEDTMYNFQLWAVSYNTVIAMARDVLNNVKALQQVQSTTSSTNDLPTVFVKSINRERTNIELEINNTGNATNLSVKVLDKLNEDATEASRTLSFVLQPKVINKISIPVSDSYESNLYFTVNGVVNDLVYMNDGTWNINHDANTSINKFDITNGNYSTNANEYPLYRKVAVSAATKGYITAYKLVKGGGLERNFNDYKAIKFNASAAGAYKVKITLVKKGIDKWDNQYSYTLPIESNEKEYAVSLTKFVSAASAANIDLKDITAINFTWENNAGGIRNIDASISKLRFVKDVIANVIDVTNDEIVIYPNPNQGKFTANFAATEVQPVVLKVLEVGSGKIIYTQYINAKKGTNTVAVDLKSSLLTSGLFMVTIEADGMKYKPVKLVIGKE